MLGPTLFNLFISDVIFSIKKAEVCNFADDTTIHSWRTYFYKAHKHFMQYRKKPLESFDKNTKTFIPRANKTSFRGLYNVDFQILSSYMDVLKLRPLKIY